MACGVTHVMDIRTLWCSDFWPDGRLRLITAGVSTVTAIMLWKLISAALALPSPETLRRANAELTEEIARCKQYVTELCAVRCGTSKALRARWQTCTRRRLITRLSAASSGSVPRSITRTISSKVCSRFRAPAAPKYAGNVAT